MTAQPKAAAREALYPLAGKTVWVAGHRGMVGSAVLRRLETEGCILLTAGRETLDLTRQDQVEDWFAQTRPDAVVLAAAKVGGILANNTHPADFIRDNLAIQFNVIEGARLAGVGKLLFLGSSCIYPKMAPQPLTEDALLTGPLEPTNEWYAVAKIAGIKMCQAYRRQYDCDYISAMPTNLYGPGDNFDLETSHVGAALMVKAHQAKLSGADSIEVWGSGTPRRELLHVDDLADGCVHLLKHHSGEGFLNIGTGHDATITEIAKTIAGVVGFEGRFTYDRMRPDGTPRKLMDVSRMASLGWQATLSLEEGMRRTYAWYLENADG